MVSFHGLVWAAHSHTRSVYKDKEEQPTYAIGCDRVDFHPGNACFMNIAYWLAGLPDHVLIIYGLMCAWWVVWKLWYELRYKSWLFVASPTEAILAERSYDAVGTGSACCRICLWCRGTQQACTLIISIIMAWNMMCSVQATITSCVDAAQLDGLYDVVWVDCQDIRYRCCGMDVMDCRCTILSGRAQVLRSERYGDVEQAENTDYALLRHNWERRLFIYWVATTLFKDRLLSRKYCGLSVYVSEEVARIRNINITLKARWGRIYD